MFKWSYPAQISLIITTVSNKSTQNAFILAIIRVVFLFFFLRNARSFVESFITRLKLIKIIIACNNNYTHNACKNRMKSDKL